jgi:cell division protein ZapE
VHPSRYGALCDGVEAVCLRGVHPVTDQATALRLVVLADRLYDREVPVLASGEPFDRLFTPEMLAGGYRKKYFRAISRLTALAREADRLL